MSNTVKKGIKLFISITVISLIIILLLTVQQETLEYFKNIKPMYFILAFVAILLYYFFDGIRVQILAKGLSHNLSLISALEVVIGGIFLAAITPFQTGGLPVQLYVMKKENIPYGSGMLILFMRGITYLFFYLLFLPIIFYIYMNMFSSTYIAKIIKYLIIIYSTGIILLILTITLPEKMILFILLIDKWLKKMKIVKSDKIKVFAIKFHKEVKYFLNGLKLFFSKKKLYLFLAIILTFISFSFFYSIAIIILLGLNVKINDYMNIINLQFLHTFLAYFMPTPGASGISEALFTLLFKSICPKSLLGIFAILERFFTFYLGASIGGFLILRTINKTGKTIEEITKEEQEEIDEDIEI